MKHAILATLLAAPASAANTDHAACISIVDAAYEAAETIMDGRMAANDLVVRSQPESQRAIIDTGSAASDAIVAYIDTLAATCELLR